MKEQVSVGGEPSDAFVVNHGLKQGCVLQSGPKPLRLSINIVKTPTLPITPPSSPRTMLFSTKNYLSRRGPTLWRGREGWNSLLLRKIQVYIINYALLVRSQGVLSRIEAQTIFSLYLTAGLETKNEGFNRNVFIRTRTGGRLINLAGLRTHTKTVEMCIRELLYADDSAPVGNNVVDMQQIVDRFFTVADMFDLKINISKTELLYKPPPIAIELP